MLQICPYGGVHINIFLIQSAGIVKNMVILRFGNKKLKLQIWSGVQCTKHLTRFHCGQYLLSAQSVKWDNLAHSVRWVRCWPCEWWGHCQRSARYMRMSLPGQWSPAAAPETGYPAAQTQDSLDGSTGQKCLNPAPRLWCYRWRWCCPAHRWPPPQAHALSGHLGTQQDRKVRSDRQSGKMEHL